MAGSLEVVVGCMYSGKTEELVRRLTRAQIAGLRVGAFKPKMDNRYSEDNLCTHLGATFPATPVTNINEVKLAARRFDVIGIDEVQFIEGASLCEILDELASEGQRVIVAGLDLDYQGVPFAEVPDLMALADSVTKVTAVCCMCGNPATRTQRLVESDQRVLVGSKGMYEARCREDWSSTPGFAKEGLEQVSEG
jgi:thymidine kinase